jgi:PhnB protein
MEFYRSVLGGEIGIQTSAAAKMARTPAENNLVVHAVLRNDGLTFMASDAMTSQQANVGDSVHMNISGQDSARLTMIFDGLPSGWRVDMPLAERFWGDTYGQLTAKFGIHWIINITSQPQQWAGDLAPSHLGTW